MFAKIKSKLFASFTWYEFIIGGFNFGAGTTCINAAWNNYLYYGGYKSPAVFKRKKKSRAQSYLLFLSSPETTLRLVGIILVLGFCGCLLSLLELMPRPNFVQRHISHLNTYIGRSVTYLLLGLLSSDTANQKKEHRIYLYTCWMCAASMAFYAAFYAILSICDKWYRNVPLPKSMNYDKGVIHGQPSSSKTDALEMNKESGWTVTPADGEASYTVPDTSIPYGDPFDQASIAPSSSGWTHHPVKEHLGGNTSPSIGGASQSSYGYQIKTADYSYGDETHVIDFTTSQKKRQGSRSRDNVKASISNPLKRITYNREYSSSQDQLLPPVTSYGSHQENRQFSQSASCDITSTTDDWILRASESQYQSSSPLTHAGYQRDAPQYSMQPSSSPSAKLKRASTRKHKRVYVPGIGSFDLSSGSESEGEEKRKSQVDLLTKIEENGGLDEDDEGSVYSLDSNTGGEDSIGKPITTLGRKLTRKETLTYRNKLDRGMQRARDRASASRI